MNTPSEQTVPTNEIQIDDSIMPRQWSKARRQAWAAWAHAVLDRGTQTGEWPLGTPVLSDHPAERGPNGERYTLLGFADGGWWATVDVWDRITFRMNRTVKQLRNEAAVRGIAIRPKASRDEVAYVYRAHGWAI